MKRRALIIGSPLHEGLPGYLRGVPRDMQNIIDYLQSSVGGGWHKTELHWLVNPTEIKIQSQLNYITPDIDIAVVYYSGHGFMLSGNDYLNINKDEVFQVSKLVTAAKRQLIFVDSCRVDCGLLGYGDPFGIGMGFDRYDIRAAREIFDYYVSLSPVGGVITYSSLPNQASMDFDQGGVYTVNLLRSLQNWYESNKNDVLTIGKAFGESQMTLLKHGEDQIPEQYFIANKNAFEIPFAINPRKFKLHFQSKSTSVLYQTI